MKKQTGFTSSKAIANRIFRGSVSAGAYSSLSGHTKQTNQGMINMRGEFMTLKRKGGSITHS